jgi:hypothetical protein
LLRSNLSRLKYEPQLGDSGKRQRANHVRIHKAIHS